MSVAEEDLVLSQLTRSMLPSIGRPGWPSPLALDHLNLILGAHVLQKYGGLRKPPTVSVGGLGPSQKRRATELLSENLSGRIRLSELAAECGLSISHFARSFKASFGVSAHRWLVQRRIERSQELLIDTHESLADIADQAGFCGSSCFHSHVPSDRGHQSGSMEARLPGARMKLFLRFPIGRSCTSDETRGPLEVSPSSILARNIGSFLDWTLFPTLIRTHTAHQPLRWSSSTHRSHN